MTATDVSFGFRYGEEDQRKLIDCECITFFRFFICTDLECEDTKLGVMNGPLNFLTARKIYLCSICSQHLNDGSLACAPQIFAIARKLAFLSVLLEIL